MTSHRPAAVIVLAAGEGTRMKSAVPKVLHSIGGRSLVHHAIGAARGAHPEHLVVVVRHGRDLVAEHVALVDPDVVLADQDEVKGTGRATECGLDAMPALQSGTVVVTSADTPLLESATLVELVESHQHGGNAVTVLTARVADPRGYGRIVRDAGGQVSGIVEDKDASPDQLAIQEINSSIYAFDVMTLRTALREVGTDNAQGERYLTDVVSIARRSGGRVAAYELADTWQIEGVNDRVQLAALGAEMNSRIVQRWMRDGVTVVDPATTWFDADVTFGRDVTVLPHTQIHGASTIGSNVRIGPDSTLRDMDVRDGATLVRCDATLSVVGPGASVGPYAYLRPGTELGAQGKIGTFVETKNSTIGAGAKVPHLTYCGDATIGEGANIGAGTIFANYDGIAKHRTTVGRHSFVGSDSVLIAPVDIADGVYVAAGSAIDGPVKPGQIAVARGRQRNIDGWVERRRSGTSTAAAAAEALAAEKPQAADPAPSVEEKAGLAADRADQR